MAKRAQRKRRRPSEGAVTTRRFGPGHAVERRQDEPVNGRPEQRPDPEVEPEVQPGAPAIGKRRTAVSLGIAVLLLGSVVAGVVLVGGGGETVPDVQFADGTVVDADEESMIFRPSEPIDGETQIKLSVPPEVRGEELDPEHLLYHASGGGAMRVYFERDGDDYVAVSAYDLPGLR